ncbi:MAG: hypothetical protein LBG83_06365 [Oscillospiraceae bacterium]|nr:hypothetical protein [Oscillospiraceae bacterium]
MKKSFRIILAVICLAAILAVVANAAPFEETFFQGLSRVFGHHFSLSSVFSSLSRFFSHLSFWASLVTWLTKIFSANK